MRRKEVAIGYPKERFPKRSNSEYDVSRAYSDRLCVHAQRTRCGACGFQVPTWVEWGRDRCWNDGSTHGSDNRRDNTAVCGCQRAHRAVGGYRATSACIGCSLSGWGWDWALVCLRFDGRRVGCWWIDTGHCRRRNDAVVRAHGGIFCCDPVAASGRRRRRAAKADRPSVGYRGCGISLGTGTSDHWAHVACRTLRQSPIK